MPDLRRASLSDTHWRALQDALEEARAQRTPITYRHLAELLQLPPPAIQTLTGALETLATQDAAAGRPFRSALVISQAGSGLPRPGFFEHLRSLGCYSGAPEGGEAEAWFAAELARLYESVQH
ncbi:Conserved hypothetical protein [gamma proteobacterium HdN1]|nr:Conserved hypothetical protein [gamma proteobacterium HdN1]